jgi:hypothetical protein
MSELQIITNNVPRDVLEAHELSAEERADFDYLDWSAIERGEDSASFVRYKGELLDLGDLERTNSLMDPAFSAWDGYRSDSFFSGVLMRWAEGFEAVVMGRYYS